MGGPGNSNKNVGNSYGNSMEIPWKCMEIPWTYMEIPWKYGNPMETSMDILWKYMEIYGDPMEIYGNIWRSHGNPMEIYGNIWKSHGNPMEIYGNPHGNPMVDPFWAAYEIRKQQFQSIVPSTCMSWCCIGLWHHQQLSFYNLHPRGNCIKFGTAGEFWENLRQCECSEGKCDMRLAHWLW